MGCFWGEGTVGVLRRALERMGAIVRDELCGRARILIKNTWVHDDPNQRSERLTTLLMSS